MEAPKTVEPTPPAEEESVWQRLHDATDAVAYRPKVRDGIVWRNLTTARGEDYVIVQNPGAATYLRLTPEDFFVFGLMDGTASVRDLVVAYMMKFQKFALPSIARLVNDLRINQFLADPPHFTFGELRRRAKRKTFGDFFDSYFGLIFNREFPIQGIDGVLSRAYDRGVWILFTQPALLAMALVTVIGVPYFVYYLLSRQFSLSVGDTIAHDLLGYYVSFLFIAMVHEMSHAFTVKAHGRVVRRGGFAIFFGLPGMFVDTQDMWMETRGPRMAASWAGPYSGLVLTGLTGLALLVWPDSPWSPGLRLFGIAALVNNVLQLMPLIQLDGYFILMDWLEIPQLRTRALAFVQHDLLAKIARRQPFNREERIFAIFGVLAAVYTFYAITLAVLFWWNHAQGAIQEALRVPSVTSLLGLTIIFLLLTPFVIGLTRRGLALARSGLMGARRASGLARERWYHERLDAVAQTPALASLGREASQALVKHFREEWYEPGSAVVRQGDSGDRFYLVVEGEASVIRETADRTEAVATLHRFDYFGERALIENVPRAATVRAETRLRVFSVDGKSFRKSLEPYIGADSTLRARFDERAELDKFALFEPLGSRQKDLLLSHLRTETYAAGEAILREGDVQGDFYCIRSGRVEITRDDDGAVPEHVAALGAGEFFGEVALLMHTARTATVTAVEDSRVWVLSGEDFHELLGHYFNLESRLAAVSRDRLPSGHVLIDVGRARRSGLARSSAPAPAFALGSADGASRSLEDFRGRQVALWFSRGWSDPSCGDYARSLAAACPAQVAIVQVTPDTPETARLLQPADVQHVVLCDPGRLTYVRYGVFAEGTCAPSAPAHGETSWLEALREVAGEQSAAPGACLTGEGLFLIDERGTIRSRYLAGPMDKLPDPGLMFPRPVAVAA